MSLHGLLALSLYAAVKVNPELPWILEDVGDTRAKGYLSRKVVNKKWNEPMK